jgi:hypothetical protein
LRSHYKIPPYTKIQKIATIPEIIIGARNSLSPDSLSSCHAIRNIIIKSIAKNRESIFKTSFPLGLIIVYYTANHLSRVFSKKVNGNIFQVCARAPRSSWKFYQC